MEKTGKGYVEASDLVFSTNPDLLKEYQDGALKEFGILN